MVGWWAVPYVGFFFRPVVGDEPFFLFLKYRPPTGAWVYHVPTAALLCPLLPYVLLPCYYFVFFVLRLHTEDDTFTTVRTALPYCPVILWLFFVLTEDDTAPAGNNGHYSGVPLN